MCSLMGSSRQKPHSGPRAPYLNSSDMVNTVVISKALNTRSDRALSLDCLPFILLHNITEVGSPFAWDFPGFERGSPLG